MKKFHISSSDAEDSEASSYENNATYATASSIPPSPEKPNPIESTPIIPETPTDSISSSHGSDHAIHVTVAAVNTSQPSSTPEVDSNQGPSRPRPIVSSNSSSNFVSFTQQKLLLQRHQFLTDDSDLPTTNTNSFSNPMTFTSSTVNNDANSVRSGSSTVITAERQQQRQLRDLMKQLEIQLGMYKSIGIDPLQEGFQQAIDELSKEHGSSVMQSKTLNAQDYL